LLIEEAAYIGTFEIQRDFIKEAVDRYYPDNNFNIPKTLSLKVYVI